MEVQFGDKPKAPSSLWHMIKICFVLLICCSQIPHCCWHCRLRLHGCPWITVQLFLLFFLLISTEPRKCHLHLVEKLYLQTLETNTSPNPHPQTPHPHARMLLSRNASPWRFGNTRGEVFPDKTPGGGEVFFLLLTPEISLLLCLSLQNRESNKDVASA